MKKIIYNKFSKGALQALPRVMFKGRIMVVDRPGDARKAVDYLLKQPILGLDTETRPSFQRGQQYKCALLQVSTPDMCVLFRLCHSGLTGSIKRLLEDKKVMKVGLAWNNDLLSLKELGEFTPGSFIELQREVKKIGIEDQSLVKIYANLFGERISKGERLSNWERSELTEGQKHYAAIDAWACIRIYEELQRLSAEGDYELVKVETNTEKKEEHETDIS